jgi:O-acetyl-ADP-ribose deacetylase (regulator of RNase III)
MRPSTAPPVRSWWPSAACWAVALIYGYPKDEVAAIAVDAVRVAPPSIELVRLVAFSSDDLDRYERLLS